MSLNYDVMCHKCLVAMHTTSLFVLILLLVAACSPASTDKESQADTQIAAASTDEIWEPVNAVVDGDTINRLDENGALDGQWLRRYGDGSFMCTGTYSGGAKEGYWERKYPNGNWEYQANFKDGETHGEAKFYHENGQLRKVATYEAGGEQGEVTIYREDGTIEEKQWFINGIKGGPCTLYKADGQLEARGQYAYNRRDGIWTFYKDGKETMQLEYDNGAIK